MNGLDVRSLPVSCTMLSTLFLFFEAKAAEYNGVFLCWSLLNDSFLCLLVVWREDCGDNGGELVLLYSNDCCCRISICGRCIFLLLCEKFSFLLNYRRRCMPGVMILLTINTLHFILTSIFQRMMLSAPYA